MKAFVGQGNFPILLNPFERIFLDVRTPEPFSARHFGVVFFCSELMLGSGPVLR
jgi:hypothetical protein